MFFRRDPQDDPHDGVQKWMAQIQEHGLSSQPTLRFDQQKRGQSFCDLQTVTLDELNYRETLKQFRRGRKSRLVKGNDH